MAAKKEKDEEDHDEEKTRGQPGSTWQV